MPKVWWLKAKTNELFQFLRSDVWGSGFFGVYPLFFVSQDWTQAISWSGNLGLPEGECPSRFIQLIGKTQFHGILGLKSLILCWLLAKDVFVSC